MESSKLQFNYGGLRDQTKLDGAIVYFRRGLSELSLNITNACPNACTFCIRDSDIGWGVSNLYLPSDPSVDDIISAYDSAVTRIANIGSSLSRVKICGYGEPILRFDDLLPIARYISRNGPDSLEIQITTTGWPYFGLVSPDPDRIMELKDAGVSHIYLSMNAINSSQYVKLVRPGIHNIEHGAFMDSLRFGKCAQGVGLDVTLGFIRIAGITEEQVRCFSQKHEFTFKIRNIETA